MPFVYGIKFGPFAAKASRAQLPFRIKYSYANYTVLSGIVVPSLDDDGDEEERCTKIAAPQTANISQSNTKT